MTIAAFAAKPSPATTNIDRDVRKAIERFVTSPVEHGNPLYYGVVLVRFTFDCTGRVELVHLEGSTPELENHVATKLSRIKFDDERSNHSIYTWRFVFKPQRT